jgi:hypothetical protein
MQTLISVFDKRGDARKAADRLVKAGFARDCVHLREGEESGDVVVVDARSDGDAEVAAVILHDQGAALVNDRESNAGEPVRPGVRAYKSDLRAPLGREESLLADRAGQVSREMKEDREERAYAAPMNHVDRDRPK